MNLFWQANVGEKSFASETGISLAPGFSPVWGGRANHSRFNGFSAASKAAAAAETSCQRGITEARC
jgi:hypothetical protein